MDKARRPLFFMLFFSGVFLLLILILQPIQILHFRNYIAILFPKGIIGVKELDLMLVLQVLMLFIVIPVYIFTFIFSWKYSVHNPKHKYDPDLVDHKLAEYIWWGVPLVLTLIASTLTIIKSYQLDPYKPIASDKPPLTIQVVALQWKWLFIYPEEKVASVNFFQIPKDVPIHFQITSDAPMNSFWIPQLGGQIYAMPNMQTELHLIANQTGDFRGASANISGEGFAGMHFIARASDEDGFKKWIAAAQASASTLDFAGYQVLAKPSQNNPVESYQLKDSKLFHQIMMKYRR